jgi:hypothetical protein
MGYRLLIAENTVQTAGGTLGTGNTIANSAASNAFASVFPMPGNLDTLANGGKMYRLKANGYISTLNPTPGTLILKILYGATQLAATAAMALPTGAALTNQHWELSAEILICATGTSGKVRCVGGGFIDGAGVPLSFGFVNTGTGVTDQITVNTQAAANLSMQAQFSVANAANIIVLTQWTAEELTI